MQTTAQEIRAWAKSRGMDVGKRGRIAPAIVEAFYRSQAEPQASNVRLVAPVTVTYPVSPSTLDAS